jgi:hypothetical protein
MDRTETLRVAKEAGLLTQWIALGASFSERAIENGFGLLRDLHGELAAGIGGTLAFGEAMQRASLGAARHVHERGVAMTQASLDHGEAALLALVGAVRSTSDGAAQLASRTAAVITAAPATEALARPS